MRVWDLHPTSMNNCVTTKKMSSLEETRPEFNPGKTLIKLGIDVHQEFYVVVCQEGGGNPKPAQRFQKEAFLSWAARLKQKSGAQIHAVYEACGFGFGLQRQLAALKSNPNPPPPLTPYIGVRPWRHRQRSQPP